MPRIYFVGVDVGTGSARAALVNSQGQVIKQHSKGLKIWNPSPGHYEQSSDDIWNAVCCCVQYVVEGVCPTEIVGISFDATCSLVALGDNGMPITVSTTGEDAQNVILWMDHRADKEAEIINTTKNNLLKYVGGKVSLEMELPKLLWLKRNLNISCWSKIWRVFDLPDFLTWRCTGSDSRSLCSVVCKWNYDAANKTWSSEFLKIIGLGELCENNFEKIGQQICEPGSPVGCGLSDEAAQNLGLLPQTYVGTSLIDAHAGALALFGCKPYDDDISSRLGLICGTSTCHMSLTRSPCWTKGIWGPYGGAIFPEYFLNEGGQSATGVLLDYIISIHPQVQNIKLKLTENEHIYTYLNNLLIKIAEEEGLDDICFLTKDFHVWPDFHGNRSPVANPNLKGMITGLSMVSDEKNLAILYLAFVQALSYGTKHIIESLVNQGRSKFTSLIFSGGLSKNQLYVQTHADVCNIPAIVPHESEMVLVGASMLGACASKVYPDLKSASRAMGATGRVIKSNSNTIDFHSKKYRIFLKMLDDQLSYQNIMDS